jgi:hypothetical protein
MESTVMATRRVIAKFVACRTLMGLAPARHA